MINEKYLCLNDEDLDWLIKVINESIQSKAQFGDDGDEQLKDKVVKMIFRYFQNVDEEFEDIDWVGIDEFIPDLYEISKYKICKELAFDTAEYGVQSIEYYIEDRTFVPYYMIRLSILKEKNSDNYIDYEFRIYELYKTNGKWNLDLDDCCVELWKSEYEIGYVYNEENREEN